MIITESQLRLIVRQELLEVLNENNADVLNEGLAQFIARNLIPLIFAGTTGASLGTAAMQHGEALPGEPAEQQILHTVGSAEMSDQEIGRLEQLTKRYLQSITKKGNVATHNDSGMKFDATTNLLTYKPPSSEQEVSVRISENVIKGAKKYLTLSKSGKHPKSDSFLGSPEGAALRQEIQKIVDDNPTLEKAVEAQGTQNISFAIATMCLIMTLIMVVLGFDERYDFPKGNVKK